MTDLSYRWQLRQLPRERAPTRDLWAGIEAAIATPRTQAQSSPATRDWRVAGSAIAASLVLGLLVLGLLVLGLGNSRLPEALRSSRSTNEDRLVLKEADAIRRQYQAELRQFRDRPMPAALAPALIELDQSADNIMTALNSHPDAVFLLDQLHRTYARRLALTQRVAML